MRTTARALFAASIILASLLATSCDNDFGVFQSVQDEKEQIGTTVFRKTTATGAFGLGDYYYACTSTLYRRSTEPSATTWDVVPINGSSSYSLRSAVAVGSDLYALISDTDPTDSSLKKVFLYKRDNADVWTEVARPSSPYVTSAYTFDLDALYSAGDNLYAEGHLDDTSAGTATGAHSYTLYHFDTTTSKFTAVENFSSLGVPIRGVASDGTNYWFASKNLLYSGPNADGSGATSIIGNFTDLSSKTIWWVSYAGAFYVSTADGYLYQNGTAAGYYVDDDDLPLSQVIEVPKQNDDKTIGSIILVGTDSNDYDYPAVGYYEGSFGNLVVGSTNHIVASTSGIYSSTVSAFPVHAFYYDSVLRNLFICVSPGTTSTDYYGLYESSWTGSSWSGWDAQ
jgi:hypothetical protein